MAKKIGVHDLLGMNKASRSNPNFGKAIIESLGKVVQGKPDGTGHILTKEDMKQVEEVLRQKGYDSSKDDAEGHFIKSWLYGTRYYIGQSIRDAGRETKRQFDL